MRTNEGKAFLDEGNMRNIITLEIMGGGEREIISLCDWIIMIIPIMHLLFSF